MIRKKTKKNWDICTHVETKSMTYFFGWVKWIKKMLPLESLAYVHETPASLEWSQVAYVPTYVLCCGSQIPISFRLPIPGSIIWDNTARKLMNQNTSSN